MHACVQIEAAVGKPPYPGPSDYLILSVVTMIMCGILNLTSLTIGIPGLVFACMVSAWYIADRWILLHCAYEIDTLLSTIIIVLLMIMLKSCLMHETC